MPRFNLPDDTNVHAMCQAYGHDWRKSDILTGRAKGPYRIEVCARKNCDAGRRILER